MSASKVKAGEAYVELGIRNRIAAGMQQAEKDLKRHGAKLTSIGAMVSTGAASLLAAPVMAASNMQETLSKFSVVFADSAAEVGMWGRTTARAMQIS